MSDDSKQPLTQVNPQTMNNEYKKPLPALDGSSTDLYYFDVEQAVNEIEPGAYAKLPFSSKVLCENLVRRCPPEDLTEALHSISTVSKRLISMVSCPRGLPRHLRADCVCRFGRPA